MVVKRALSILSVFILLGAAASQAKTHRVLVGDAGGMHAVKIAHHLAHLEKATGLPAYRLFDEFWGVDTSALVFALATIPSDNGRPLCGQEIVSFFSNYGTHIYTPAIKVAVRKYLKLPNEDGAAEAIRALNGNLEAKFGAQKISTARSNLRILAWDKSLSQFFLFKKESEFDVVTAVAASMWTEPYFGERQLVNPGALGKHDLVPFVYSELTTLLKGKSDRAIIYVLRAGYLPQSQETVKLRAQETAESQIQIVSIEPSSADHDALLKAAGGLEGLVTSAAKAQFPDGTTKREEIFSQGLAILSLSGQLQEDLLAVQTSDNFLREQGAISARLADSSQFRKMIEDLPKKSKPLITGLRDHDLGRVLLRILQVATSVDSADGTK